MQLCVRVMLHSIPAAIVNWFAAVKLAKCTDLSNSLLSTLLVALPSGHRYIPKDPDSHSHTLIALAFRYFFGCQKGNIRSSQPRSSQTEEQKWKVGEELNYPTECNQKNTLSKSVQPQITVYSGQTWSLTNTGRNHSSRNSPTISL